MRKAFCPPDTAAFNPMLDWVRKLDVRPRRRVPHRAHSRSTAATCASRRRKRSTRRSVSGALHPADLKNGIAEWLVETLEPARRVFEAPEGKALLEELERLLES